MYEESERIVEKVAKTENTTSKKSAQSKQLEKNCVTKKKQQ